MTCRNWLLALFAAAFSLPAFADFTGKVIAVADGDTITVLRNREQVKIRLVEIDAPEKNQPYGNRSKQSLSDVCFGKIATLADKGQDRYGRTLARVTCNGIDANAEQVKRGMAWAYTKYLTDPQIKSIETEARATHRGLWSDRNPTPPWEWRAGQRENAVKKGSGSKCPCGSPDVCVGSKGGRYCMTQGGKRRYGQ